MRRRVKTNTLGVTRTALGAIEQWEKSLQSN